MPDASTLWPFDSVLRFFRRSAVALQLFDLVFQSPELRRTGSRKAELLKQLLPFALPREGLPVFSFVFFDNSEHSSRAFSESRTAPGK